MEQTRVRLPPELDERIEAEVKEGKYPNKSEAIRSKLRDSYILEAMLNMHRATDGVDEEAVLDKLDEVREDVYDDYTSAD